MAKNFTKEEWLSEGLRLFGGTKENPNLLKWRFKCPKCGHVASGQDFKDAGVKDADLIAKHCIGRHVAGVGCDWAAYGLFDICTVHVDGVPVFEFALPDEPSSSGRGSALTKQGKVFIDGNEVDDSVVEV